MIFKKFLNNMHIVQSSAHNYRFNFLMCYHRCQVPEKNGLSLVKCSWLQFSIISTVATSCS